MRKRKRRRHSWHKELWCVTTAVFYKQGVQARAKCHVEPRQLATELLNAGLDQGICYPTLVGFVIEPPSPGRQ